MDSCKKRNRVHSNHYSNYQPNYCDESSHRESFDGNYARSSKSNSESPNSHRPNVQSTYECKVCLNTYQSNKDLYAHLHAAQHLRPLSRLNVPEDEETFPYRKRKFHGISCKVCFYEFDTQNELKRHLSESGHHWTTKRAKQISNLDKSAFEHNEYSDHQRHLSSTNARSDGSFACQNLGLMDEEESRRKDSIHFSRSYGFSVLLDEPVPVLEKDIHILDGDNSGSSKVNDANVNMPMNSSNLRTDNDQSIITSPDNSILVSSKMPIELSSTSESQKGMAVIPMESSIPTIDPRQNVPNGRPESDRTESRNLSTKWAPIYCDRPKPNLVEKRIPWKLIPIDLSPSNYPGNPLSDSRTSISRVPSPTEDVQDVSIDQLAAQLKENTGATFIPNLRTEANVSHSPVSFEGNLLSRFNRDSIPILSRYANSPEVPLHSPIPCQDGVTGVQGHTVTKTVQDSDGKLVIHRTGEMVDKGPCQPSSSRSPFSPKCDYGTSSDKTHVIEVPSLSSKVMPPLIPPPVIDHQVEAAILKALGSLNSILNASELLSTPIQPASSQVIVSNNPERMDAPQSPVFVDKDKSQTLTLSLVVEKNVQNVESCLFQISGESVKEVANIDSSENSSVSSPKPTAQSVTTEEVVDSCPSCETHFDVRCMKIDLKTGNASITCLGCDVHVVMANVFKKAKPFCCTEYPEITSSAIQEMTTFLNGVLRNKLRQRMPSLPKPTPDRTLKT